MEIYKGKVRISSGGDTTERSIDIRKIDPRTHRVTIPGLGQGEIQFDERGNFKNQPWATAVPITIGPTIERPKTPEIHRIEGTTEKIKDTIKGKYRLSRDGEITAEGDFKAERCFT